MVKIFVIVTTESLDVIDYYKTKKSAQERIKKLNLELSKFNKYKNIENFKIITLALAKLIPKKENKHITNILEG